MAAITSMKVTEAVARSAAAAAAAVEAAAVAAKAAGGVGPAAGHVLCGAAAAARAAVGMLLGGCGPCGPAQRRRRRRKRAAEARHEQPECKAQWFACEDALPSVPEFPTFGQQDVPGDQLWSQYLRQGKAKLPERQAFCSAQVDSRVGCRDHPGQVCRQEPERGPQRPCGEGGAAGAGSEGVGDDSAEERYTTDDSHAESAAEEKADCGKLGQLRAAADAAADAVAGVVIMLEDEKDQGRQARLSEELEQVRGRLVQAMLALQIAERGGTANQLKVAPESPVDGMKDKRVSWGLI